MDIGPVHLKKGGSENECDSLNEARSVNYFCSVNYFYLYN